MTKKCPRLKKPCIEHDCMFWMQMLGKHPQTGAGVPEWDCADRWRVILLIEGSQETRQAAAAIESFRNEMVGFNVLNLEQLEKNKQAEQNALNDGTA